MPALSLEFNSNAPGLTLDRARSDFEAIWQKNVVEVEKIRQSENQDGDYFHEDEGSTRNSDFIYINIQGSQSDAYRREKYGLTTTDQKFHCFARHFEDIKNQDVIIYLGEKYTVENINRGLNEGATVFWEFDIKKSDAKPTLT